VAIPHAQSIPRGFPVVEDLPEILMKLEPRRTFCGHGALSYPRPEGMRYDETSTSSRSHHRPRYSRKPGLLDTAPGFCYFPSESKIEAGPSGSSASANRSLGHVDDFGRPAGVPAARGPRASPQSKPPKATGSAAALTLPRRVRERQREQEWRTDWGRACEERGEALRVLERTPNGEIASRHSRITLAT
jgi:hypothetical protein